MKAVFKLQELDLIGLMLESLTNNKFVTYPFGVHWGTLGENNKVKFLSCPENNEAAMHKDFEMELTLYYLMENENNYTESVDIVEDCLIFEKPMTQYLERFM